jgi:hypothetical protein
MNAGTVIILKRPEQLYAFSPMEFWESFYIAQTGSFCTLTVIPPLSPSAPQPLEVNSETGTFDMMEGNPILGLSRKAWANLEISM